MRKYKIGQYNEKDVLLVYDRVKPDPLDMYNFTIKMGQKTEGKSYRLPDIIRKIIILEKANRENRKYCEKWIDVIVWFFDTVLLMEFGEEIYWRMMERYFQQITSIDFNRTYIKSEKFIGNYDVSYGVFSAELFVFIILDYCRVSLDLEELYHDSLIEAKFYYYYNYKKRRVFHTKHIFQFVSGRLVECPYIDFGFRFCLCEIVNPHPHPWISNQIGFRLQDLYPTIPQEFEYHPPKPDQIKEIISTSLWKKETVAFDSKFYDKLNKRIPPQRFDIREIRKVYMENYILTDINVTAKYGFITKYEMRLKDKNEDRIRFEIYIKTRPGIDYDRSCELFHINTRWIKELIEVSVFSYVEHCKSGIDPFLFKHYNRMISIKEVDSAKYENCMLTISITLKRQ